MGSHLFPFLSFLSVHPTTGAAISPCIINKTQIFSHIERWQAIVGILDNPTFRGAPRLFVQRLKGRSGHSDNPSIARSTTRRGRRLYVSARWIPSTTSTVDSPYRVLSRTRITVSSMQTNQHEDGSSAFPSRLLISENFTPFMEELQHLASTVSLRKTNLLIGCDAKVGHLFWSS